MTRRQRVWGWVTNWRNGVVAACSLLAVVLLLVVTDAIDGRQEAFRALERETERAIDARRASSRRIDLLQARIDELVGQGQVDAQVLGQLVAEVDALRTQVEAMGGDPVVARAETEPLPRPAPPATTTTTRQSPGTPPPSTTTTTAPPGNPRPEPQPDPEPGPFPCRSVFVPVLCEPAPSNRKATP